MNDPIEDLLRQTLGDERRIVATPPAALLGVRRAERRLRLRRAFGVGSAGTAVLAAVAVALTAGGTASSLVLEPTGPAVSAAASLSPQPTPGPASPAGRPVTVLPVRSASVLPSLAVGVPARLTGTVRDDAGHPLAAVRVLSKDLRRVLTRTDARGRFAVACTPGLVFAPYAFGPFPGPQRSRVGESSPGVGNLAFRTRDTSSSCGRVLQVTLPAGGVVEGTADAEPGAVVALSRVVGGSRNDADGSRRYGWFTTRVRPDGTYRISGLATGRYSIETSYDGFPDEATFLDVHEGRRTDGSYTYTVDTAVCYEQPQSSPECDPTPTPSPSS